MHGQETIKICTKCFGIQYKYIWGLYREQNLAQLQYRYARLNIASILLKQFQQCPNWVICCSLCRLPLLS